MKLIDGKTKLRPLSFLFMFLLLIYTGGATYFARSIGNILTFGNAVILLFSLYLFFRKKIRFERSFILTCGVFLLYATATSIQNRMVNPMWILQWFLWLFYAYIACKVFKNRFLLTYESVMFILAAIALVFWILEASFPEPVGNAIRSISFLRPYAPEVKNANIIFYTIQDPRNIDDGFSFMRRNPGFAWEPGAYSVLLCLALYCNLIRTKWRLKRNPAFFLFLVSLISTQSTTGLTIFGILLVYKLFADRHFILGFSVLALAVIAFVNVPFLLPKLSEQISEATNFDYEEISYGSQQFGRIRSFILAWEEFRRHPILGLGGYAYGTELYRMGFTEVALISGAGELLSMYGIIMTSLFLFLIGKSSQIISRKAHRHYGAALLIIIVGLSISYSLWRSPLIMAFWMSALFNKYNIRYYQGYTITKASDLH